MTKRFTNQGKLFREARNKKGLTQIELAGMLDMHPQAISNTERGLSGIPKICLRQAVKVLEVSRQDFEKAIMNDAIEESKVFTQTIFRKRIVNY